MSAKPVTPRLGRGLAALFSDMGGAGAAGTPNDDIRRLPIDLIEPNPFQPRMNFDPEMLQDLADSIRAQGMLQPVLVRPGAAGRYEIIAGERRWRAAGMSGLHEIPVICRTMSDAESAAAALIENLQRENLNPIEEAEGYQRLIDNFGLTQETLGLAVSKSRAHVGNILRLLSLPEQVRDDVRDGKLSFGHARALVTVPDPAAIAEEVMKKGLSVRQTERLVQRAQDSKSTVKPDVSEPDTAQAEHELTAALGYKVKISASAKGDGALTIWFSDLFQLDDLIARLTAPGGGNGMGQ